MNSSRKDILLYLLSFVLLAISFVFFILAFYHSIQISYYIFSTVFLIAFCIYYKLVSKRIACDEGYNLIQAYIFYKKCVKTGVIHKSKGFEEAELKTLMKVASEYDFAKKYDLHTIKKMYLNGYKTEKTFKTKRKK